MNYAQKLRAFARWLDQHPAVLDAIDDWDRPSVYLYYGEKDTETFSAICRGMGTFDKHGSDGTIRAIVDRKVTSQDDAYGTSKFRLVVELSGACQRVEKRDENGDIVTRPVVKYEHVPTGEMEPVYEWKCPDSFLNLGAHNEHAS